MYNEKTDKLEQLLYMYYDYETKIKQNKEKLEP